MCVRLFENTWLILTVLPSEEYKKNNEYKRGVFLNEQL